MASGRGLALTGLAAICGATLFMLGAAVGPTFAPEPQSSPAVVADASRPSDADSALLRRIDALAGEIRSMRLEPGHADVQDEASGRRRVGDRAAIEAASGDAPGNDRGDQVDQQILARLAAIEMKLQSLREARPTEVDVLPNRIPPGTTAKDYFRALKSVDGETVRRAHRLWSTAQIAETYGQPDEIKNHEDYVEWIYRLGEDEQFDFHFSGGLCTQAH